MVTQREPPPITVAAWRALEQTYPDRKIEYIDGQVYFMPGGSLAHSRIGSNMVRALEDALGTGASDDIELTSINVHIPLDLLYRATTVATMPNQQEQQRG